MKKLLVIFLIISTLIGVYCFSGCKKNDGSETVSGSAQQSENVNSTSTVKSTGKTSGANSNTQQSASKSTYKSGNTVVINPDGTRDFEGADEINNIDASWKSFNGEQTSSPTVTDNSVTFTYDSRGVIDTLVGNNGGVNQSIASAFDDITSTINSCEFVYTMKVKANESFTFILFAGEGTKSEYTDADIVNNVAPKMGVYLTFTNTTIEVKAALGNGTSSKSASSVVSLKALDGKLALDGKTENDLKISLERYAYDNIMIQIYIDDYLVSFQKLVPNLNEDVYGLSLRTGWDGVDDGLSIGVNDADQPSPFIRVSRGLTQSEGLGKGFAVIPNKTQTSSVTLTDFTVLRMG